MSDQPFEKWWRDEIARNDHALDAIFRATVSNDWPLPMRRKVLIEHETGAGPADLIILWGGAVTVVEFKRDEADESAVAQVLRYGGALAWYEPHLAVAARAFTQRARYAASGGHVTLLEIGAGSLRVMRPPSVSGAMLPYSLVESQEAEEDRRRGEQL